MTHPASGVFRDLVGWSLHRVVRYDEGPIGLLVTDPDADGATGAGGGYSYLHVIAGAWRLVDDDMVLDGSYHEADPERLGYAERLGGRIVDGVTIESHRGRSGAHVAEEFSWLHRLNTARARAASGRHRCGWSRSGSDGRSSRRGGDLAAREPPFAVVVGEADVTVGEQVVLRSPALVGEGVRGERRAGLGRGGGLCGR